MDFEDPHSPVRACEIDDITWYLNLESELMLPQEYSQSNNKQGFRRSALRYISRYSRTENFDPFIPYLGLNYFDRFFSQHDIWSTDEDGETIVELLAISCLWLACKMRSEPFNLMMEEDINIGMEKMVTAAYGILEGLGWRMQSVTPFCFIQHLFGVCRPRQGVTNETIYRIVFETQKDIRFTAFRPSIISASELLAAFWYLYRPMYQVYEDQLGSLEYIDETELSECVTLVKEMCEGKQLWMETCRRVQAGGLQPQPFIEESLDSSVSSSSSKIVAMERIEGSSDGRRPGKEPAIMQHQQPHSNQQQQASSSPHRPVKELTIAQRQQPHPNQQQQQASSSPHRPGKGVKRKSQDQS